MPIRYFDYQATTPLDPQVYAVMRPWLEDYFGNPHSAHSLGTRANAGMTVGLEQLAGCFNCRPDDIIITSGATESNNLALKGVMEAAEGDRRELIVAQSEHSCTLAAMQDLRARGFVAHEIPIRKDGQVDLETLRRLISPSCALVSVMAVHNEIGTVAPIKTIGEIARANGALYHCDAAQAVVAMDLDLKSLPIDLLSISGHKCYGPKGVGALIMRPEITLHPQIHGGGQQRGIRGGTQAPWMTVALAEAVQISQARRLESLAHMTQMRDFLLQRLQDKSVRFEINGSMVERFVGNLNLTFVDVYGNRLHNGLRQFAVSSGSACAAMSGRPSQTLKALGRSRKDLMSTLRIGFSHLTKEEDVLALADAIADVISG